MSKNRHKMQKKAMGGKTTEYNAIGSPEMSEAKMKTDGFKKGGKKKKEGGSVAKEKSHKRMDKKPRKHAAGGPVYSSASKKTAASKDEAGQGHEGDGPKGDDPDRGCYKTGGRTKDFKPGGEKGKLHREMGIPEGEKIPAEKLRAATHSSDPEKRRDAIRAETMKKWRHTGPKKAA